MGAGDVLLESGVGRELEAALELAGAVDRAARELRRADVVERVDENVGVAEALGQLDRPGAPLPRSRHVAREHPKLGHVAVGHRQLGARRQRLEQPDRGASLGLGLGAVAGEPGQPREPAAGVALAQPVAPGAVLDERQATSLDRLVDGVDQVALVRTALEQVRPIPAGEPVGEAKRPRELRGRLAVRAEVRRALGCGGSELEHGWDVAGGLGVVCDAGDVGPAGRACERAQGAAVKLVAAVGRHRLLDRHPLDLVAEGDSVAVDAQHPRRQALLDERQLDRRDLLEQPQLRTRRRDRDRVEQRPGAGGQAGRSGEHGVTHALGERRPARREGLGDVERVAARHPVKLGGVDLVRPREVVDRALGERLELRGGSPRCAEARRARAAADRCAPPRRRGT